MPRQMPTEISPEDALYSETDYIFVTEMTMKMKDIHTGKLFSTEMKMSEVPDADPRLLGVMRRLGIRFGFGEKTVAEVCAENGVNPHTLLLICKIYIYDKYLPSREELSRSSMSDIVTYLHGSHDFYTGIGLVNLEENIQAMSKTLDERHSGIIMKFCDGYKSEILKHFEYEENTVFPYIHALAEGRLPEDYNIDLYEENHSDVDEKLNDLKSIVMKYMPQTCDDNLIQNVLMCLYTLEDDLGKHTYIEDEILVPMVTAQEKTLKKEREEHRR